MTVARKFRAAWHGQLMTRVMILTNELPSLNDGSGALAGRFIVSALTKSFFSEGDPALTNKLTSELSGILNSAIGSLSATARSGPLHPVCKFARGNQRHPDAGCPSQGLHL